MKSIVRMAAAGNGMPVFTVAGQNQNLRRVFGATWDTDRALWMYPAFFPVAKKVLKDFETLNSSLDLDFSDTAQAYIKELGIVEERYKNLQLPKAFEFVTKPYDHQILGLCHAYYMPRAALYFDPGLGKSKVAIDLIRLLHFEGNKKTIVILGPLVTIRNWGKELDIHSGGALQWGAMLGTPKQKTKVVERAAQNELDVLLLTYDTARNFGDLIFKNVSYSTIIADESHLIKDWRAARTKAAYELAQKTIRRLLLTGTPTLGNPMDLYGQFRFLGDFFMPENWLKYKMTFLNISPYNKHLVIGYKNLSILNARTTFLSLRRSKEECLDLPPQTFVDLDVELTNAQAYATNHLIETLGLNLTELEVMLGKAAKGEFQALQFLKLPHVAVLLIKLLQISAGFLVTSTKNPKFCDEVAPGGCEHMLECVTSKTAPYTPGCKVAQVEPPDVLEIFPTNPKLDALEELLDTLLGNPTHKVIVWCYFHVEMDLVEARLKEIGLSYVRVDGKTGAKIQSIVDRFNADPSVRVYLAQVSTGVGVTLNAANYTVYYSLTFNLGSYLQSLDRNYRIGQKRNVTVYRLFGRGTIEPTIMQCLENKVSVDIALTTTEPCADEIVRKVVRPKAVKQHGLAINNDFEEDT